MIGDSNVASESLVLLLNSLNAVLDILPTRRYSFGNFSVKNIRFGCLYGLHTGYHRLARYPLLKSFMLKLSGFHAFEVTNLSFLLEEHLV
jgi:hypothetical protein